MTSYASENSDIPDSTIEVKLSEEEVIALKTELATCKDYESQIANTYSVKNYYESNDTIATAYPYENTEKIKHQDGEWQGHFNCYYAYTRLETEDDLDFFKITVTPGIRYVIALKNVCVTQVRDIRLYYQKPNGDWYYVYVKEKKENQTIGHFYPTTNTYYIRISGEAAPGCTHDSDTNWFAVEPDGTIDERPLIGSSKPSCSLQ